MTPLGFAVVSCNSGPIDSIQDRSQPYSAVSVVIQAAKGDSSVFRARSSVKSLKFDDVIPVEFQWDWGTGQEISGSPKIGDGTGLFFSGTSRASRRSRNSHALQS